MQQTLQLTENEVVQKERRGNKRYPTLTTVLMVEDFLKEHRAVPMKIVEIKRKLPKQIMHQSIIVILNYLWKSGKIIYGPKGIQWIFAEPEHLKKIMENSLEI